MKKIFQHLILFISTFLLQDEVFATSCPTVGESHLIHAYLENESMDIMNGCSFNINVTVLPSVSIYVYIVDEVYCNTLLVGGYLILAIY